MIRRSGLKLTIIFCGLWFLALALLPPAGAQEPAPVTGLPQILEFHRKLCPICQEAAANVKAVQDKYPGQFVVKRVYMGEEGFLFRRYQVAIVPTQIFLDAAGKEVFRQEGVIPPEKLEQKLKELKFIRD